MNDPVLQIVWILIVFFSGLAVGIEIERSSDARAEEIERARAVYADQIKTAHDRGWLERDDQAKREEEERKLRDKRFKESRRGRENQETLTR